MRKVRIFNHVWHIGHQHSLIKATENFAQFYWLEQYKRPFSTKPRGDLNVIPVEHYESGFYDVAVLHLDQQCLDEEIWQRGKARLYRDLNEVITDIPKILIFHATPYWPEKFSSEEIVRKVREVSKGNVVVMNSRTAVKQFGFGIPIIHGMDPIDWSDLPKERRVVTMIGPGGLDMYYDRALLHAVKEMLLEEDEIKLCHISVDWVSQSFEDYKDFLGRSLVYFNPTRESPMPRSRTEAMLSGCCVVTTPTQDASDFIKDGVNGLLIKRNPKSACDKIRWALTHYDEAITIGQEGKKTATELFHIDRYREDWRRLLSDTLGQEVTNEGIERP